MQKVFLNFTWWHKTRKKNVSSCDWWNNIYKNNVIRTMISSKEKNENIYMKIAVKE